MTTTKNLDTTTFDAVTQSGVSLIDFYADWCGPCRALAPTVEELAVKHGETATIAKVDVDANSSLAQRFGVRSIPTVVALKDGQEVERLTGRVSLEVLEELLERAEKA